MKILIIYESMVSGGVEKSIINFLNSIDYSEHEVDLYLNKHVGEFYDFIPKEVNLLNAETLKTGDAHIVRGQKCISNNTQNTLVRIFSNSRILQKLGIRKFYYKKKYRELKFEKEYDIAIVHNVYLNLFYIMLSKVKAKYKCAVCHGDYGFINKRIQKDAIKEYRKLDTLFFVSESCEKRFHSLHKRSKVVTDFVYNMQDTEEIVKKSKEYDVDLGSGFNIVSVSRLSEEKAHIRTLGVLKKLKEEGLSFNWHIVGDGPTREEIESKVKEYGLEDCVNLHGNQKNPYPYMKSADLFYLGSYHEAAPMVYAEAMSLKVPVLTTETCSARELVGDYGFVCENSEEGVYNGIKSIINNANQLTEKKEKLNGYVYNNDLFFDKIKERAEKIVK